MENVLCIHGFNSGKGQKAIDLENAGYTVFCPQLSHNVHEDIKTLSNIIENESIKHIIGTSLGGYYTLVLGQKYPHLYFYAINPAYKPFITLRRHLNETVTNFKTGELFYVNQEFLNDLKTYFPKVSELNSEKFNFYFGTEDEVLDFSDLKKAIELSGLKFTIVEERQSHRFKNISTIIQDINKV